MLAAACRVLELGKQRAWRWLGRRAAGRLDDRAPSGPPRHGLLAEEVDEIVAVVEADLGHRGHVRLAPCTRVAEHDSPPWRGRRPHVSGHARRAAQHRTYSDRLKIKLSDGDVVEN
jgi:hypothetical protein